MRPGIDFVPDYSDEIRDLERQEFLVRSNEGTFGATECLAAVGTGDSTFGNRREYETAGGHKRIEGPDFDSIPGRMLSVKSGREKLNEAKAKIKSLREEQRKYQRQYDKSNPA